MNNYNFIRIGLLTFSLITTLCIGACTTPPLKIDYYTLTTTAQHAGRKTENPSTILIGPVRTNSFLDQGPIVKQTSPHSVNLLEQHHWAGNLDEMLSQILIQNLIVELATEKIYAYPDSSADSGIRLDINFFHFEEDSNKKALLQAKWKLIRNSDQSVLHNSTSTKTKALDGSDYDALAKALSQCLAELSHEIADKINQIHTPL